MRQEGGEILAAVSVSPEVRHLEEDAAVGFKVGIGSNIRRLIPRRLLEERAVAEVHDSPRYKGEGEEEVVGETLAVPIVFGDSPQYTGTFNGDTLVFKATIEYPGGSSDQKMDWYQEGSNVRLKVYNDIGKGPTLVIDQIATPVGGEKGR
jgi:hypothetical protein